MPADPQSSADADSAVDASSASDGRSAPDPAATALAEALATVGDRWTLLVVAALLGGPRRFGDLQQAVDGIAPNVLTQRLRALERNALVIARPYSERPPRFVYELSAAGRELAGVLRLLAGWGARGAEETLAPRHAACGTPMEARWWCPTCERAVDAAGGAFDAADGSLDAAGGAFDAADGSLDAAGTGLRLGEPDASDGLMFA